VAPVSSEFSPIGELEAAAYRIILQASLRGPDQGSSSTAIESSAAAQHSSILCTKTSISPLFYKLLPAASRWAYI
jgi:hypothetical protein